MTDAESVVGALAALGKRRDAAPLAHRVHLIAPSGENLVRVALVSDVPHDAIVRRVVEIVEGDREFDRPETGREVAAGLGDALDEIPAEFPDNLG